MGMKDPAASGQKWAQRLGAAGQAMTDGANALQTAPGALAAAQADVWLAKLQASRDKWIKRVSAVTLAQWRDSFITKGIPRVSSGAQQAIPKFTAFLTEFLPHVERGRAALPPRGTIDQNLERARQMALHNATFQRTR